MWKYWKDKYGIKSALEDQYPKVLRDNTELQQALMQIKTAEAYIDNLMHELEDEQD